MKERESQVLKAGVWYTISTFLVKGAAIFTTPIFTRLLTTSEVGNYANLTSWVQLLIVIVTFDLYTSVNLAHFDFPDDLDSYISSILLFGTAITGVFYVVVIAFIEPISKFMAVEQYQLHLVFIYMMIFPAVQIIQVKYRVYYEYKKTVFLSISTTIISVLAALIMTWNSTDKLSGRLFGYYGSLTMMYFAIYVYIVVKGKRVKFKYIQYALRISIPMIFHMVANYILSSCDRVMIIKILGEEQTALYSIAYNCALVISLLWSAMNTAWSPWFFDKMKQTKSDTIMHASKYYMLFFGVVAFGVLLFSPEFLLLMGGETYMEAKYVIPPVVCGYVCQFVYSLYVNIEYYYKKQKVIAIGTMVAGIANFTLNLLLIPRYGYLAAAYTTLASYFILFIIHYENTKKFGNYKLFSLKFVLSYLAIMLIASLFSSYLYDHKNLRYCCIGTLIICLIIICIQYRNRIALAIKKRSLQPIFEVIDSIRIC